MSNSISTLLLRNLSDVATHPDFKYQPLSPPEELGDAGRVRWVSVTPGKLPAYAGTDFIVAGNGRIASVYFFSTIFLEAAGGRIFGARLRAYSD